MLKWLHHLMNPHCEHCLREERIRHEEERQRRLEDLQREEDSKVCESCETLKAQLAIANQEKGELLARLIEKPEPELEREAPQVTRPRSIPWAVRRQILEEEDRARARALKGAAQSTQELEKEVIGEPEKEENAS